MIARTIILVAIGLAASNTAQLPTELIRQALDEPANVSLQDTTLREAVNRLTDETGVPIHLSADVLRLVPGGGGQPIRELDLTNEPLRVGLAQMFEPLGMRLEIRDDHVEILPRDALLCLGRPPKWDELETLNDLRATSPGLRSADREWLRARIQFTVAAPDVWGLLDETMARVGAGNGEEVLTVACDQLGLAWCMSGRKIVVSSLVDQHRQRLTRNISLRMNYRPLVDVLQELSRKIALPVKVDPRAVTALPLQVQRSFSVNAVDAPVEFVLDKIAAHTGLAYVIEPEGIMFYDMSDGDTSASPRAADTAGVPQANDPYVGKIVVPLEDGTSVEWHIRMSELPPDLRMRREADLKKAFERLRDVSP